MYFRDVNKKKRYEINLSINKGSGVKHTDNCKLVTNFMTFFSNFGERKHVNDRLLKKNGKSKTCVNYGDHLSESLDRLTVEYYFRNKGDSIYFMKGWCRR